MRTMLLYNSVKVSLFYTTNGLAPHNYPDIITNSGIMERDTQAKEKKRTVKEVLNQDPERLVLLTVR
jgi:hypothetical protein